MTCRFNMAAYAFLRRNKTSIVDTLGLDYTLILNIVYENKLITAREYNNLERPRKKSKVNHLNVGKLVDKIMNKGEKNCQAFLKLLQIDGVQVQETYPEQKNILEDEQYELKSQPTGLCLIINNKHFVSGDVRRGTDKDAERLAEVFSWLGFRVLMCKDQTKDQMEQALKCFASQCDLSQLQEFKVKEWNPNPRSRFTNLREAPQHGDAFICCVLSHGDKGVVLGVDWQPLRIKQITRTFMATPQSPLKAKPKVFLIQACQGRQIHPMVESSRPLNSDSTPPADGSPSSSIPQEADFLVHSSTVQECYANRDPMKGSVFIQSVCNQLIEGCERKEDIEVILRRVNKEVAGKERVLIRGPVKQMPKIWHTLRKRLVLTPRN
ncbi:caspase-8-like [Trematomus bernacchii]|uniref:caspase-8-like n=1 Tax=Trematomus bernacchii TaxID=40690 RepID=UPI00146F18CD|nr:caspase-8-like [Trematomus bernacchii]